jgi:hypothetical protein
MEVVSLKKIISRGALFSLIVAVLSLLIFVSGCGGSGIQGLENSGSTIDGSSVSKSLYSADKDKSSKQCLYSKVTYTLDTGKIITYQFDPDTLSAVTPSKSSSQDSSSSSTQETRSSGVTRQAYDGTVMGLGDSKAAYVTDKLVATTNAYTFFPGAGFAEEYIVCPEPSVYPESNVTRQGITVVPSPESGLGPITYTPTAPSFTGAVHIVANYFIPDDPPKPWHESWEYVYLVGNPVPVLTQYYSENGIVMGLQFTMGMGSDTENIVLPRTLGDWHFISNNNKAHSDDIIKMRELSIKDPVTFVADDNISNKIKVQAEIEELPTGSWTANIARAKDVIVDPNTQETSTIDLIWDPATKYLAGDWIYNSGVITAALSKGFSCTAREIADSYMHTITAYEDTVKTFAMKSAGQEIAKLTIENAKATPKAFTPGKKEENNKTNITAQIAANSFQADSIKWKVTIKDEADATVKTFDERTGVPGSGLWDVSETWNGKNDSGDYVDYGTYSFNIAATATSNGTVIKAKAVVSVKVAPQFPTLTKLTFENTLNIKYDNGENVKPIYYNAKDSKITQNPFAIPLSRLTPVDSDNAKGKCNITLEIPNKPVKAISFEVRIKSHNDKVIVEKEYITFDGNKKESSKDVDFTVPNKIQTIKGVIIEYMLVKKEGGSWVSKSDWKEDAIAKPKENIWTTLDEPEDPLGEHGKDKVRTGMLDIVCDLDNVTLPEEERPITDPTAELFIKLILRKVHDYLETEGFVYNSKATHSSVVETKNMQTGKKTIIGTKFDYTEFKDDLEGDCQDVSNFYTMCCRAVGLDMKLRRLTFGEGETAETWDFISLIGQQPKMWPFQMHQTGSFEKLIYDPLIKIKNKYYIRGVTPGDYQDGDPHDYIDLVFEKICAPGKPQVIWSEELPLMEVKLK